MATSKQTVIIAENDPVTYESLRAMLSKRGFKVMRYLNRNTLTKSGHLEGTPCVLILGDMAGLDFLKFLKTVRWTMPAIYLHSCHSISDAVRAIQLGAADYIAKPFSREVLVNSVKRSMKQAVLQASTSAAKSDLEQRALGLTAREWEVINLVISGLLNKEIAERLDLALVTVKVHRGSAMRKLGARTAAELARITQDIGFIRSELLFSPNGKTNLPSPLSGPTPKNQGVTARK
jgi:FixJ family two-component response regulator